MRARRPFATGTSILLALGLVTGCSAADAPPEVVVETPESTPEPAGSETRAPSAVSAESLRISADLPAEELARASVELVNAWSFAGATEETVEATSAEHVRLIQEEGMGYDAALAYIAEGHADYYDDAVLVDDWESNPDAVEYRQHLVNENLDNMVSALARHTNGEPLSYWTYDISDVEERDHAEGERLIKFTTTITPHNSTAEPGTVVNYRNYDITSGSALIVDESSQLS